MAYYTKGRNMTRRFTNRNTKGNGFPARYSTTREGKPLFCWDGCGKPIEQGQMIHSNPTGAGYLHKACAWALIDDPQHFTALKEESEEQQEQEQPTKGKKAKRTKLNVAKVSTVENSEEQEQEAPEVGAKLALVKVGDRTVPMAYKFHGHTLSQQQEAPCLELLCGSRNIQVVAGPGCGKSYTLEAMSWVAHSMGLGGVYIAFGNVAVKSIQAGKGLAPGWSASTSHSEGRSILAAWLATMGIKLPHKADNAKVVNICKSIWDVSKGVKRDVKSKHWCNIKLAKTLVSHYKSQLKSTAADGHALMQQFNIVPNGANVEEVLREIPHILNMCEEQAKQGIIDFDDMIWAPLRLGLKPQPRDLVFVDESQDFTPAQLQLALSIAGEHGRTVTVGDARQAIYRWRGAARDGMEDALQVLKAHSRGAVRLPLMETRRCSKASVALCNMLYPHSNMFETLQAHSSNHNGVFVKVTAGSDWLAKVDRNRLIITSRVNAPLVSLALRLLKAGQKAVIRGRDFHSGIIAEINRLNPVTAWNPRTRKMDKNEDVAVLLSSLDTYVRLEREKLQAKGEDDLPQSTKDQHDCIRALADGQTTVSGMLQRIADIFSEENADGAYILSTVHQVKGLEADWIAVIGGKMPGPWADTKEQRDEETSIQWVAFSRTKYALVFEDMEPATGLPVGYGWTPLDDAIAQDPTKPTDPQKPSGASQEAQEKPKATKVAKVENEAQESREEPSEAASAKGMVIRISTTLDVDGSTRDRGANAIDICTVESEDSPPTGGKTRTLRTMGWRDRVIGKINEMAGLNIPTFGDERGKPYVKVTKADWDTIKAALEAAGCGCYYHVPQRWKMHSLIVNI